MAVSLEDTGGGATVPMGARMDPGGPDMVSNVGELVVGALRSGATASTEVRA